MTDTPAIANAKFRFYLLRPVGPDDPPGLIVFKRLYAAVDDDTRAALERLAATTMIRMQHKKPAGGFGILAAAELLGALFEKGYLR
jgi:hypothetical protein